MNDKPLTPWVIASKDGQIVSGHCNCMAGMGETCSHIASLLWVIASGVQQGDSLTCTEKSAYWNMPSAVRSVPYSEVRDISFTGKTQKQHHAAAASCSSSTCDETTSTSTPAPPISRTKANTAYSLTSMKPTEEEKTSFFTSLGMLSPVSRPVILSVIPGYCDSYVPVSLSDELPSPLSDLFEHSNLSLSYYELLQKAINLKISITPDEAKATELKTRMQANSRLWFQMRAGRITASKFKAACHTNPASPSISLIMSISHPDLFRFSTKATRWVVSMRNLLWPNIR